MSKAFSALMPAHHELMDIVAEHIAGDYAGEQFAPGPSQLKTDDPLLALLGNPQLVAIAQQGRELALTTKKLLNEMEEADFAEAALTGDRLSHLIRMHYLASRSDATGVAR